MPEDDTRTTPFHNDERFRVNVGSQLVLVIPLFKKNPVSCFDIAWNCFQAFILGVFLNFAVSRDCLLESRRFHGFSESVYFRTSVAAIHQLCRRDTCGAVRPRTVVEKEGVDFCPPIFAFSMGGADCLTNGSIEPFNF